MSKNVKVLIGVFVAIALVVGGAFYFKNGGNFGGRIKLVSSGDSGLVMNKDVKSFLDNAYGTCAKAYLKANADNEIDCMSLFILGTLNVGDSAASKSRKAEYARCKSVETALAHGDWSARFHPPRVIPDECEWFSEYDPYYLWNIPTLTLLRCERVANTWAKGGWTYRYGSSQLRSWCSGLYSDTPP